MTVAVYPNLTRENGYEVSCNVIDEFKNLGVRILMPFEFHEEFSDRAVEFYKDSEVLSECDFLIAIGGDGTIIHAANYIS